MQSVAAADQLHASAGHATRACQTRQPVGRRSGTCCAVASYARRRSRSSGVSGLPADRAATTSPRSVVRATRGKRTLRTSSPEPVSGGPSGRLGAAGRSGGCPCRRGTTCPAGSLGQNRHVPNRTGLIVRGFPRPGRQPFRAVGRLWRFVPGGNRSSSSSPPDDDDDDGTTKGGGGGVRSRLRNVGPVPAMAIGDGDATSVRAGGTGRRRSRRRRRATLFRCRVLP